MDTRVFSVYNLARAALLNSAVEVADSAHQPLKLLDQLISGLGLGSQAGLWLRPVKTAPLVPRVFPFDFLYLDENYRVLRTAEIGPGIDFPPYQPEAASALLLPSGRLLSSKTQPGDCLIICRAEELDSLLAASTSPAPVPESSKTEATPKPVPQRPTRRKPSSSAQPTPAVVADAILLEKAATETASPRASAKTALEQSILNAIARADQQDSATIQLAPALAEPASSPPLSDNSNETSSTEESAASMQPAPSKPSISITEVVLDHARVVPAAVVEHHTDPEDLFSNWVVTPSFAPAWVSNGFDSAIPSKPVAVAPQSQQAKLESAPLPAASGVKQETSSLPTVPLVPGSEPENYVRRDVDASPASPPVPQPVSEHPHLSGKRAVSIPQSQTPAPRTGVPQISTASTLSATPYTMWQVSMPTAVTAARSAESSPHTNPHIAKPSAGSSKPENGKPNAVPAKPEASAGTPRPATPQGQSNKGVEAGSPVPARRSTDRPAPEITRPTSAQFISSVQERLERLQQTPGLSPPAMASSPVPVKPTDSTKPASEIPALAAASRLRAEPSLSRKSQVFESVAEPAKSHSPAIAPSAPVYSEAPKARIAAETAQTSLKAEPPLSTLKSKFKKWLNPTASPSDRRRASRRYVPGMVAHYFTGGAPKPHAIADISMTGFYLLTEDRWMPGTMIQMTLQKPCAKGEKKQSITVLSRIVRRGSDGVATEFVMPGTLDPYSHDVPVSQATDKFALARFL